MLQLADVGPRAVSAYREFAPDGLMDSLVAAAASLRGARVLHVNATPYGGGVSELLRSIVPILNDLGIVAHWRIIRGDNRFFQVTKKIHNGLQGAAEGLTEADRESYLGTIELDRPLMTQVSRFDPWKDPMGVIEAFQIVGREIPDLQLALVGSMALDDPEGWRMYNEITDAVVSDPSVHVFTNLVGVGNVEVNAFQRLSTVVVQKSLREGFGLVVSETLWKETPVVAGRAGGIPLQMADGAGGRLAAQATSWRC